LPGARRGLNFHVLPARRVAEVVVRYAARARTPAYIHSPSAMSSKVVEEHMLLLGRRKTGVLTKHLHLPSQGFKEKCFSYAEVGVCRNRQTLSVLRQRIEAQIYV